MAKLDMVGVTQIAEMFGVHRVTVARWRRRGLLPAPDADVPNRPAWRRETIIRWAARTGRQLR